MLRTSLSRSPSLIISKLVWVTYIRVSTGQLSIQLEPTMPLVINLIALDKPPAKEALHARKRKVMMIITITKIDYNPVVTPESTESCIIKFGPKDAEKVHTPHSDNLIVRLKIANSVDVFLNYIKAFVEMRLLPSMLTPPASALQ